MLYTARCPRTPCPRSRRSCVRCASATPPSWRSTCIRTRRPSPPETTPPTRSIASLRERARAAGLWAPHIGPEAGGTGRGFLAYAFLNEQIGRSYWAQLVFGCQAPDAGNSEILSLHGDAAAARAVAASARRGRGALVLRDDRARGLRRRPDDARRPGALRRRRVGDRRAQVVLDRRRRIRLRDRHGGDRSRRAAPPAGVALPRAHRVTGASRSCAGSRCSATPAAGGTRTARCDSRVCACPRTPCSASAARGSGSHRSGSGPGGSTTSCAGSARCSARSISCARTASPARRSAARLPTSRRSRPGSPTPPRRSPPAG